VTRIWISLYSIQSICCQCHRFPNSPDRDFISRFPGAEVIDMRWHADTATRLQQLRVTHQIGDIHGDSCGKPCVSQPIHDGIMMVLLLLYYYY
jgi:hypothetical protein